MPRRFAFLLGFATLLSPVVGQARNVEPGKLTVAAGLGPGFRLGDRLGGSGGYLLLMGEGEYTFSKSLSAVADLALGLAGTKPLRLALGARYRLPDLDLPVSPYVQAQLTLGRLYGVLNTNVSFIGARVGAGADYMLTAQLAVGGLLGLTLASTTGERSAFYGVIDVLAYARYTF